MHNILIAHMYMYAYPLQKLPKVNKQLAERLLEDSPAAPGGRSSTVATGAGNTQNPIGDDRFAALFTNPDFEVDEASEEYQLLHPVLTHREKTRVKKRERQQLQLEKMEQLSLGETEVGEMRWMNAHFKQVLHW